MATPRKLVVAGLITDGDQVLLTRRPEGGPLALEWEFPGGKIEPGESPRAALARELREEIGVEVEVGQVWEVLYHRYPDFDLVMLVFAVRLRPKQVIEPLQVADFEWVGRDHLEAHPILEADRPLLERLVAEGVPAFESAFGSLAL